ncbi:atlastin-1-like isoform X2 [Haemaphysalis longicornis]
MARPVQIVRPKKGSGIWIDMAAARKILLERNIRNKPVVVISVAGESRSGKSYLMNWIVLYLREHCQEPNLLNDRSAPVQDFSCLGGSERQTTGIWMWNEVFVVKGHQGDEVAVVVMDTHGMFDSDTAFTDRLSMLAFTASVSSVLLYNITHNIQENDLQRLGKLVEYGRTKLEKKTMECVFQKLVLVVRDWNFPRDAPYGEEGGKEVLYRRLRGRGGGGVPPELQELHDSISSAFKDIDCFLLPHPGREVATATSTDGALCKADDDFLDSLNHFFCFLLTPEKLVVKEVCGKEITCEALANEFKILMDTVTTKICNPTLSLRKTPQTVEKCLKFDEKKQFSGVQTPSTISTFLFVGVVSFITFCMGVCVRYIAKVLEGTAGTDPISNVIRPKVGPVPPCSQRPRALPQKLQEMRDKEIKRQKDNYQNRELHIQETQPTWEEFVTSHRSKIIC